MTTPILDRATLRMALGIFGPVGSRARNLIMSFLRLVPKCIYEYKVGRDNLVELLETQSPPLAAYFRAQGHFENCVQSLHRALLFFDGVRRAGIKQSDGSSILPDVKRLSVLSSDTRQRLNDMRDAIEHMDERIRVGLPAGHHVGLHVSKVALQLEGVTITYVEMHSWLHQLQEVANAMLAGPDLVVTFRRPAPA